MINDSKKVSLMKIIRAVMSDGKPHSKYEFCEKYGMEASTAGTRIREFRAEVLKSGGIVRHLGDSVYQYFPGGQTTLFAETEPQKSEKIGLKGDEAIEELRNKGFII